MHGLVENPEDRFYHDDVHIRYMFYVANLIELPHTETVHIFDMKNITIPLVKSKGPPPPDQTLEVF